MVTDIQRSKEFPRGTEGKKDERKREKFKLAISRGDKQNNASVDFEKEKSIGKKHTREGGEEGERSGKTPFDL